MHADARSTRHFMRPVGFIVHCLYRDINAAIETWSRHTGLEDRSSSIATATAAFAERRTFWPSTSGNQAQVDIMVVAPVPAFTAVDFCPFNPAVLNAIDGSDVYAVGADKLHMLFIEARAFKSPWQRSAGPVLGDFVELKGPYCSGFHSRANLWASAICSGVICLAT